MLKVISKSFKIHTLWLFRDGLPIKNADSPWQTISHNQMVNKKPSYGKSPCLMVESTISMVIFNSKLLNYQMVCATICRIYGNLRVNHLQMGHFQ